MEVSQVRKKNVIGYWMSEKKSQKLNWSEFSKVCRSCGYELVKLDLNRSLEDQGPFSVIIHKLNDIIAKALKNDPKAQTVVENVENYVTSHPEVVIIDPLENVRMLLDRYKSYQIIRNSNLHEIDACTPPFVELTSSDLATNLKAIKEAGVKFPFICKPSVANGTDCHKMAIVFNRSGLKDCQPPCVAHTIVNHNAVLYKLFIVGEEYHVVRRPSIKNFYPCSQQGTIHFNSHDVSKPDSSSALSVLDEEDPDSGGEADPNILASIVSRLRSILGMNLLGVDVVVENSTRKHAIIDINPYPGYDGFPDFFESLMRLIQNQVKERQLRKRPDGAVDSPLFASIEQDDSGFETADSSDEKKRNSRGSLGNRSVESH